MQPKPAELFESFLINQPSVHVSAGMSAGLNFRQLIPQRLNLCEMVYWLVNGASEMR